MLAIDAPPFGAHVEAIIVLVRADNQADLAIGNDSVAGYAGLVGTLPAISFATGPDGMRASTRSADAPVE